MDSMDGYTGVEMIPLPVTLYGGSGAVSYALSAGGGGA